MFLLMNFIENRKFYLRFSMKFYDKDMEFPLIIKRMMKK